MGMLTRIARLLMPPTTAQLAATPIKPRPTAPPQTARRQWSPAQAAMPRHLDPIPRAVPDAAVRQLLARHRQQAAGHHAAMLRALPGAPGVIDQAVRHIR
jgi:hypothetical protein